MTCKVGPNGKGTHVFEFVVWDPEIKDPQYLEPRTWCKCGRWTWGELEHRTIHPQEEELHVNP